MNAAALPFDELSRAFAAIPEEVAHHGTTPPDPVDLYVVPGHEKALNPETPIVVGDRGTGKSFWSAALNGAATRRLIGRQLRRLDLESVRVGWGFSSARSNPDYPSRQVLRHLREQGLSPEAIWRTVVLKQLVPVLDEPSALPDEDWPARVRHVQDSPEAEEHLLERVDDALVRAGQRHLIVFDALDRLGDDWRSIRDLLLALKRAEEVSRERAAQELLHFEGIKQGVQQASRIRLQELQEDYVWIDQVLQPLRGMTVPCTAQELKDRWSVDGVLATIRQLDGSRSDDQDRPSLPPHALEGLESESALVDGLVEALIEVGVMNRIADGRLNIPDLFRVAAGIGRKGGVRPVR